jgi:predicted RNA-binding protein with PUA-like domain
MVMNYFLVKADPEHDYSINDLERDKVAVWDGVHNFAAIGFIKVMRPGDKVYIYHSGKEKSIVGEAQVIEKPFHNTADQRFSWAVKLRFIRRLKRPVTLMEIKNVPSLRDFALVRQSRLSVMPVPEEAQAWLTTLGV